MWDLILTFISMALCYLYAKEVDERIYPRFRMARPMWYALGGCLFGLLPMLYLWLKVKAYKKYR